MLSLLYLCHLVTNFFCEHTKPLDFATSDLIVLKVQGEGRSFQSTNVLENGIIGLLVALSIEDKK